MTVAYVDNIIHQKQDNETTNITCRKSQNMQINFKDDYNVDENKLTHVALTLVRANRPEIILNEKQVPQTKKTKEY